MENKNISQIVLQKIKKENIKPISREIFNIKKVLFWAAVALSLIIGAFTFALILSGFFNNDWDLYDKFGVNFIFKTLPYFWVISFIIFIILGDFYYRKTLLGYRHTTLVIVGVYLLSGIIFGSIFYVFGISEWMERSLVEVSPVYRNIVLNRHEFWTHPEDGLLSGKIIKIEENGIQIIDSLGGVWLIDTSTSTNRGKIKIIKGERIKVLGDIMDGNNFVADEIRSWSGVR